MSFHFVLISLIQGALGSQPYTRSTRDTNATSDSKSIIIYRLTYSSTKLCLTCFSNLKKTKSGSLWPPSGLVTHFGDVIIGDLQRHVRWPLRQEPITSMSLLLR